MRRRPGITLIEVLIAIFIMTIGLLALLTLFTLASLRMATALQDDRAASAASAGAGICDAFDMRHDPQFDPTVPPGTPSLFVTPPTPGFRNASQSGAGIPLYIDPWGVATGSSPALGASSVTVPATPGITRLAPTVIRGMPYTAANSAPWNPVPTKIGARYFTLPDDMTFLTNGLPDAGGLPVTSPGSAQRAGRYTWAYLLKRSQPGYTGSPVDLTVVVYAGRSTTLPSGENTYVAQGQPNTTSVLLSSTPNMLWPPNIRRGSWILDTTYNPDPPLVANSPPGTNSVSGDFYRVVAITTVSPTQVNLELQNPIAKQAVVDGTNALTAVTVMDDVVEVFFRGIGPSAKWELNHAQH